MTSFINDNGDELDYDGGDFRLTKQIINLFDLSIKANVSTNFKIPGTAKNRDILNLFGFNQVGGNQLVSQEINLIRNGNKSDRGSIVIIDDDTQEIECFFASGNFRWFSNFNFICNEIRTTRWDVGWSTYWINLRASATEGIIFPFIDWAFNNEKYNKNFGLTQLQIGDGTLGAGTGADQSSCVPEFYPCLYVHTLLTELSNHAGVKITGTLLTDQHYRSIILTPPGSEFVDPITNDPVYVPSTFIVINQAAFGGVNGVPRIKPETIAPKMKAIDFIKWLTVSFGCVVSFDNDGLTLSLDIVAKLKKDEAEDWSEYYKSHVLQYSDIKKNNLISLPNPDDDLLKEYNTGNTIPYGELNIESERDTISEKTLYKSPFPAVHDKVGTTQLKWAVPYVPFVKLSDGECLTYTSITDEGVGVGDDYRRVSFNGTGFPFPGGTSDNLIVRIVDDNGLYDGYHTGGGLSSSTVYRTDLQFLGTSTGKIYIQQATKTTQQYALVCVPGVSPSAISKEIAFRLASGNVSTIATAYYSKPYTPYSALNAYNKSFSVGEINLPFYNDITLREAYLIPLENSITKANPRTRMLLPEVTFYNFRGNKLIYLNVGELNGYFIVQKIEYYEDSTSEVNVYLSAYE